MTLGQGVELLNLDWAPDWPWLHSCHGGISDVKVDIQKEITHRKEIQYTISHEMPMLWIP